MTLTNISLWGTNAFVVLILTGCSGWKDDGFDCPWVAPNRQLVEQVKTHRDWVQTKQEYRWIGVSNKVYNMDVIAGEAEQFLISRSSDSNALAILSSPHWRTIVSVSPTVVIALPVDLTKVKKGGLLGTNHPVREFGAFNMKAHYDCGSVTFYSQDLQWFSPDLMRGPELVNFTPNGSARIKLPDGKLLLSIQGEVCKILRK